MDRKRSPLVSVTDWVGQVEAYVGSNRASLGAETAPAERLPHLTSQDQLPSTQRGERRPIPICPSGPPAGVPANSIHGAEPKTRAEWEARLEAYDAGMRAFRRTAPPLPDTSELPIAAACRIYRRALYGGFDPALVPQRVTDEWRRQWHDGAGL